MIPPKRKFITLFFLLLISFPMLVLASDYAIVGWGENNVGATETRSYPIIHEIEAIESDGRQTFARTSDGKFISWGRVDIFGDPPSELTEISDFSMSSSHVLAIRNDRTVAAWGNNTAGQCDVPPSLPSAYAVAAGNGHSLAIVHAAIGGSVEAWGSNSAGQTTVPSGLDWNTIAIAAGAGHSLALTTTGDVVAWGLNNFGQATVPSGLGSVIAIDAGLFHSLALLSDGTVVAWGQNSSGQSTVPDELSDPLHPDFVQVVAISAGFSHNLAVRIDGTVIGWGNDIYGQSTIPPNLTDVTSVFAGGSNSFAVKSDHTVVAWGVNSHGKSTPPPDVNKVLMVAAGGELTACYETIRGFNIILKADGTVTGYGINDHGELDIPVEQTYQWDPDFIPAIKVSAGWTHALALRDDGTVIAWGDDIYGQESVPSEFTDSDDPNFSPSVDLAAGAYHNLLVLNDGTVTGWGRNDYGQLAIPVNLDNVVAVSAGRAHSVALRSDGTVTAWGSNYGETASSPVYVGQATPPGELTSRNDPNFVPVIAIASGSHHSLALRADGTVKAWGSYVAADTEGCGYEDYSTAYIPAGLSDVVAIAAGTNQSLAIKGDGTVVNWGYSVLDLEKPDTNPYYPTNRSGNNWSQNLNLDNVTAIVAGPVHNAGITSVWLSTTCEENQGVRVSFDFPEWTPHPWNISQIDLLRSFTPNGPFHLIKSYIAPGTLPASYLDEDIWSNYPVYYELRFTYFSVDDQYTELHAPQSNVSKGDTSCLTPPPPGFFDWSFTDEGFIDGNQNGALREYRDPSTDVLSSPWTFLSATELRVAFEDDWNCKTHNPNNQIATARALINITVPTRLWILFDGMGEAYDPGFEEMSLHIDRDPIVSGESAGGKLACEPMITINFDASSPQSVVLQPGIHELNIFTQTGDAKHHIDAFYEFEFVLDPL